MHALIGKVFFLKKKTCFIAYWNTLFVQKKKKDNLGESTYIVFFFFKIEGVRSNKDVVPQEKTT